MSGASIVEAQTSCMRLASQDDANSDDDEGVLTPRMSRKPIRTSPEKTSAQFIDTSASEEGDQKIVGSPSIRGPRWSDLCDVSDLEEMEDEFQSVAEEAAKSPSKSARRATRRRRCRDAAKAAGEAAARAAAGRDSEDTVKVASQASRARAYGPPGQLMLPASAFINPAFRMSVGAGNYSATCLASPSRAAAPNTPAEACAPGQGLMSVMSTSPQSTTFGDASSRTPMVMSPFMRGAIAGSDASGRMTNGAYLGSWAAGGHVFMSSPCAAPIPAMPSFVCTSPMANAPAFPVASPSAGKTAADALRGVFGEQMCAGKDLEAKLRAAEPEVYSD